MKIYSRTGDTGDTALFGGGRVPKDHLRVAAYGSVDELNSAIGVAVAALAGDAVSRVRDVLREIQSDLFTLGADLATPPETEGGRGRRAIPPLEDARVAALETEIDRLDAELAPLRSFILPGGTTPAAHVHMARTVCRRAERDLVRLAHDARVSPVALVYLNRLSDYLFTVARVVNRRSGVDDIEWAPRTDQRNEE